MNSLLTDSRASQLHLPDIVGQGYGTFWRFKGRYRVCKGSRASKKSKTTALWYIVNLMKYPQANLLVIRKVYRTLHDSCFTDLKWAISRLGVQAFWDVKESPLELTYKPTGQKILFRGLDDPLKVTSIAAEHGYLCWAWIEEAYEISSEADFNMIDESIRGAIPPETGLFKQVTLTFNPWNEHHWLKARFFDTPDPDTLALTTNYTCNEWLDDADRRVFERMKVQNPRRYSVAGLGEFVNFFLGIIEWVLNAANGGFDSFGGAVANLIGQIISWFLSLGQVVTTIIDAIFGTNWTAGLEDLKGTVTQWGKNDTAITLDRGDYSGIQRIQYSDAWDAGYSFGQSVDSKVSGLFDGFSMDSMGAFDFGNTLERIEQNSGFTAANTAASSKKLDITSEELKYLRDIAEREAINRFTTAEVRIEQTNHNSISKDVDVDGIMDYWADWFAEKLDVSYEGVHG